jgi:hypothetical protein
LQIGGFLRVLRFHPPNKTNHHDITEILMKQALNTITPTHKLFAKEKKSGSDAMLDSISKDYKMTNDDPYRDCAALTYGPTISL